MGIASVLCALGPSSAARRELELELLGPATQEGSSSRKSLTATQIDGCGGSSVPAGLLAAVPAEGAGYAELSFAAPHLSHAGAVRAQFAVGVYREVHSDAAGERPLSHGGLEDELRCHGEGIGLRRPLTQEGDVGVLAAPDLVPELVARICGVLVEQPQLGLLMEDNEVFRYCVVVGGCPHDYGI